MNRYRILMALACAAAVLCATPPAVTHAAQASAAGAVWGRAIEVPGLGALNADGDAGVAAVSCGSAGNCTAGGSYFDGSANSQAFAASQRNGRWDNAIEVPGTAKLNARGAAGVYSVSCASAGNCTAGGIYQGGSGRFQAFVASQRSGIWGTAIEVPGTQALNVGGWAVVLSVSCASAGNCAAGGFYRDSSRHFRAFLADQRNGRWSAAIKVAGTRVQAAGGGAEVLSVSCAPSGSCVAGGFYRDRTGRRQAFVVGQRNGRWSTAIEVPGTGTLNAGGSAHVLSVSCASVGNCAAGGFYVDGSGNTEAFAVGERNGRWGTAKEVPGTGTLNAGGNAQVTSVSCASAGNCSAGGRYKDRNGLFQAFAVGQQNDRWGTAIQLLGTAAGAEVFSVSCASAGNCAAGGSFAHSGHAEAFVVSEQNGRWGTAIEVPGTATLNAGGFAWVRSVSCTRTGPCTAGGLYSDRSGDFQGFVVSRS